MEHAHARSASVVGKQTRVDDDSSHAAAVGKKSRAEPDAGHVEGPERAERVKRDLSAVRDHAIPAYVRATARTDLDPVAKELETMRAAQRVQHMLMTADLGVKALAKAGHPQVTALRAAVDELIAHAAQVGIDRGPSDVSARRGDHATTFHLLGSTASAGTESPGHKERGWIKPEIKPTESAAHVGSVFFRTKEAEVDGGDRVRFLELAKRYAGAAKGPTPGLTGRVVGYADRRRSAKPNNEELSQRRADNVASALAWALVVETQLDIGRFAFERIGAGVAADAPAVADGLAEGNVLAPFRRADIFLEGRAAEAAAVAPLVRKLEPQVPLVQEPRVSPPQYPGRVHGYERYLPEIAQGHRGTIEGMATQALGFLGNTGEVILTTYLVLGIQPRKPPWWDARGKELPHQEGKTREELLIGRAFLLVRDCKELAAYMEQYEGLLAPFARDPSQKPPEQLEHIVFMMNETAALAHEVFKLSRAQ